MSNVIVIVFFITIVICSGVVGDVLVSSNNLPSQYINQQKNVIPVQELIHSRAKRSFIITSKILGTIGAVKKNLAKLALLKAGIAKVTAGVKKLSAGLATAGKLGLGVAAGVAAAKALSFAASKHANVYAQGAITTDTQDWNNNSR